MDSERRERKRGKRDFATSSSLLRSLDALCSNFILHEQREHCMFHPDSISSKRHRLLLPIRVFEWREGKKKKKEEKRRASVMIEAKSEKGMKKDGNQIIFLSSLTHPFLILLLRFPTIKHRQKEKKEETAKKGRIHSSCDNILPAQNRRSTHIHAILSSSFRKAKKWAAKFFFQLKIWTFLLKPNSLNCHLFRHCSFCYRISVISYRRVQWVQNFSISLVALTLKIPRLVKHQKWRREDWDLFLPVFSVTLCHHMELLLHGMRNEAWGFVLFRCPDMREHAERTLWSTLTRDSLLTGHKFPSNLAVWSGKTHTVLPTVWCMTAWLGVVGVSLSLLRLLSLYWVPLYCFLSISTRHQ